MTLAKSYPLRLVCRLLGVPRSSVYYAPKPPPDETLLANAVLDLCEEWPVFGYRRITWMLRRLDWKVNAKRVRRIMADLGLGGLAPARGVRTTNSAHAFPRYGNLVKDLNIQHPEQVWVADITSVKLPKEFVYLAIVMDVFTRIIRGWHLGRSLDQGLTLAALERALVFGTPRIHHSDQGVQYAATAYVERLQSRGVLLSMAKVGEPRENGYAERLMRTIKEEEVTLSDYRDFAEARRNLEQFIDAIYNVKRIHSSLGYLTPREFEARWQERQAMATTSATAAEDRAPVGTDPSAAAGPSPIGAAECCSVASAGPQSDKSISIASDT
jgi:transposase InsO family protein